MSELKLLKKEHNLLKETLSIVWEDERPEYLAKLAFYCAGVIDATEEELKVTE